MTGSGHGSAWAGVKAVCFDLGGTLVRPDTHPTTGQVAGVLGISLEKARHLMERQAKRRQVTPAELARELATTFARPGLIGPLQQVLAAAQARAADPELYEDTIPTLRHLRRRGFALFAMTNSLGSSIPEQSPPFHQHLDAVIASAVTGFCKPERAAFAAVEQFSGLVPGELLHVGNSVRADVTGALMAGWHAAYLHRPIAGGAPQSVQSPAVSIRTLRTLQHLLPART